MNQDAIEDCLHRIAEEERLFFAAGSPEAGETHAQLAKLYKAQLALLTNPRTRVSARV
jgi:hypothetical protein